MKKLLLLLILVQPQAHSELDKYSKEALSKTQSVLTNPGDRKDALEDPKAKEMDKKVDALTGGGANKEELYDIASKVMEKITAESEGDPAKMQKLLEDAQKNPEAFYSKYFTAEEKARTRGLATKIEASKSPGNPPK